ncbi:hypothetical protein B0T16DRAFT_458965 [Cercophora newfieldiana]|uniref:Uncharacterized protein n=1 Tax=Cercophora newfieldiana TaxID=92897 RepID=A0AA39Y6Z6_9PEZI|nr:hypothetical protein B0T16DRAFT_458965 [Cercophora newfieldiana]
MVTLKVDAPSQALASEETTTSSDPERPQIIDSSSPAIDCAKDEATLPEKDDGISPISPTGEHLKYMSTSSTAVTTTQDPQTPAEPHTDAGEQWSIHWYLPSFMVFKYFLGVGFALGHHFYYRSLDLSLVGSRWPVQVGTALAFITQRCFVGAVLTAYSQWAWRTLNRKPLELATIDGVFAASRDPSKAISREMLSKATVQVMLAAACWLLPLSAIASPSTLVAMPSTMSSNESCPRVASLDFARESISPGVGDAGRKYEINYWGVYRNTTTPVYMQPTYDFQRLSAVSFRSKNGPLHSHDPCPGANCTLTLEFTGPAYKCDEKADFDGTTNQRLTHMPPRGNVVFTSSHPDKERKNKMEIYLGVPMEWFSEKGELYTGKWGTFTTMYPMWVGYVQNTTRPYKGVNDTLWPFELEKKVLKCDLNYAGYTVDLSFEGGRQTVTEMQLDYRGPVLPDGQTMTPYNTTYREFSAYHAIGFIFQKYISNIITQESSTTAVYPASNIYQTNLINETTGLAVDDFPRALETSFANLVLSLLSEPKFSPVFNTSRPCTVRSRIQQWQYEPFWLGVSYGIGAVAALVCIAAGAYAFVSNRYGVDTMLFSTILAVTRNNPELDRLMDGYSLGRAPLPERVLRQRLRFGDITELVVKGGDGKGGRGGGISTGVQVVRRAGFGSEDMVRPVAVGERYG